MDTTFLSSLTPHPEGGAFREVYRSPHELRLPDGRSRSALTHIYFRLGPGEVSRFHRVEQDEVWNLYQGALRLWLYSDESGLRSLELSPAAACFCAVAPAGHWQAAEPIDGEVLVGCSVAPGFDFADFRMIDPVSPLAERLRGEGLAHLVDPAPR
jgi:predicted cupin superfamily sugar epimerase